MIRRVRIRVLECEKLGFVEDELSVIGRSGRRRFGEFGGD